MDRVLAEVTSLGWPGVINSVVVGLTAVAVVWIDKRWLTRALERDKAENQRQLEDLRADLGRRHTVHKLQFEMEFELYRELWKALVDLRNKAVVTPVLDRMPKEKTTVEVYNERFEEARTAFNNLNRLFREHHPFYHHSVTQTADSMLSECRSYLELVGRTLRNSRSWTKEHPSDMYDSANELQRKMSDLADRIEEAIRQRIGLLHEARLVE